MYNFSINKIRNRIIGFDSAVFRILKNYLIDFNGFHKVYIQKIFLCLFNFLTINLKPDDRVTTKIPLLAETTAILF